MPVKLLQCRLFLTVVLCAGSILFSEAQKKYEIECPYELTLKRDLPLFTLGAAGQITAAIQRYKMDVFTEADLANLNAEDISGFDRKATEYSSGTAELTSRILETTAFVFPLGFAMDRKTRNGFLQVSFMAVEAYLLNAAITNMTKVNLKRTSPFAYNPDFPQADKLEEEARLAGVSAATSTVATLSFLSAKVFSDYHKKSKWKPLIWSGAVVLPAAVGHLNVRAGHDFPTDVIAGYAVGGLIGFLIPQLHKKKKKNQSLGFIPFSGGDSVGVLMTW